MREVNLGLKTAFFKNAHNTTTSYFFILITLAIYQNHSQKSHVSYGDLKPYVFFKKTTFNRNVKAFVEDGYLIECKSYNSSLNRYKRYYFSKNFKESSDYFCLNREFVRALIELVNKKKLTKTQFRVFLFLKYKEFNNVDVNSLTQSKIAISLGLTRNSINIAIKNINLNVIDFLESNFSTEFFYIKCFIN